MTLKPVDENRDKTQQRGEINVPEIQKKKNTLKSNITVRERNKLQHAGLKRGKTKVKQWLNCTITFYILK